MNLRDKLRNSPPADAGAGAEQLEEQTWQPTSLPDPETPKKKAPAEKKSLLGGLDVNKRFLMLAAGVAGLTAVLAVTYLSSAGEGLEAGGEKVTVLVAASDIPAGVKLTEDLLTTADIPKAYLPTGYFEELEKVQDRLAIAPMVAGEPVLMVRTSAPDAKHGIAYLLKKGERAKTISVDSASGLAGLIKPGNEVDLLATVPDPNNTHRRIGTPVLQKARVIAVGDRLLGEVRAPEEEAVENQSGIEYQGTVTLAIPTEKTGLVSLLEDLGNLKMVLRATGDEAILPPRYDDETIMALVSGTIPPKATPRPVVHRPAYTPPKPPVQRPAYTPPRPVYVAPKPQPKPAQPKPRQVDIIQFGQ